MSLLLTAALAAALGALPASGQTQGGDEDYLFIALVQGGADDGYIDLIQPNGHHIDHLSPGTYRVLFRDTSTELNFTLTGPHVECVPSCSTSTEGTSEDIRTVTFFDEGAYTYLCTVEAHRTVLPPPEPPIPWFRGAVHLHGTPVPPPPPPPPPGGPPPAPPPPPPPLQQPDLIGTVGPGARIELFHADGRAVTHIAPGTYEVQVHDFSTAHNFHLSGPGVNLWTPVEEIVHPIWNLTFAAGTYRFVSDPQAASIRGSFTVGVGPPPTPPRCRVPKVVGRTLVTARRLIRRSNCTVGRVRYVRSRRARGRVVSQSPRAGSSRVRGARVALFVSRGRR